MLGFSLGGAASAHPGTRVRFPTSRDTLLQIVRATPLPAATPPRVLGTDAFALRKGRRFGAIFGDLEQYCPVDLVPDRTADMVQHWLRTHPGVRTIARDRSTEYAHGATAGASGALQVADRWHLLRNLRHVRARALTRRPAHLRRLLDPQAR